MSRRAVLGELDQLQNSIENFNFDSDSDSESVDSKSTAATSVQTSPRKPTQSGATCEPFAFTGINAVRTGNYNLLSLLDCLEDVAARENAEIEGCLATFVLELRTSIPMNTVVLPIMRGHDFGRGRRC